MHVSDVQTALSTALLDTRVRPDSCRMIPRRFEMAPKMATELLPNLSYHTATMRAVPHRKSANSSSPRRRVFADYHQPVRCICREQNRTLHREHTSLNPMRSGGDPALGNACHRSVENFSCRIGTLARAFG